MNQLIIVFEFKNPTLEKKNTLRNEIREYGKFAFLMDNACIIWTEETAANVRDNLKKNLISGDKIYVGTTSAPSAWLTSFSQDVTDYLKKNLK
ncbi:hypothetical protein GCM10011344_33690 [Dokdonia pacifica]|uniref:Uncharacterized protein n=1 Tax=Dokdonia pacifica TaxID=1627892 RepID=A0A239BCS2_9FLAO|nr:hypothetical protein [Dokdonia pacifica]GGG30050.1 hypothetical protein GCM10011344_33690 [Dokdonia pacifica]SNS05815.1 hypothetical protein SAMN06265376_10687 [Dokdonia pacifica]